MTTAIMAENRTEARNVAAHLKMLEWRFVMDARVAATIPGRSVIVLAPGASKHEEYAAILQTLRARDCHLFEVDAWRERFMVIALYTKSMTMPDGTYAHEEREVYCRDEHEAQRLDGVDGWVLVTWGVGADAYA